MKDEGTDMRTQRSLVGKAGRRWESDCLSLPRVALRGCAAALTLGYVVRPLRGKDGGTGVVYVFRAFTENV